MDNFPQQDSFNNPNLNIISQCPLCNNKIIDLNIIEEINNGYLMHSKCSKCGNTILFIATTNELGINVIGMNTDLSMDEIIKFKNSSDYVEIDDAIKIKQSLIKKEFIKYLFKLT